MKPVRRFSDCVHSAAFSPGALGAQILPKVGFPVGEKKIRNCSGNKSHADRLLDEYRMTQQSKIYECIILSAAVVICLLIVLKFLTATTILRPIWSMQQV